MAGSLLIVSVAILLLGAATLLWHASAANGRQQASGLRLDRHLAGNALPLEALPKAVAVASRNGPESHRWSRFLLRAGVRAGPALYAALLLPGLLLGSLAGLLLGALPAVIVLIMVALATVFVLMLKTQKRNRTMVQQLPGVLDQVIRLVTLGNSMPTAFQEAVASAPMPLREPLDRAMAQARAGGALDQGLHQAAVLYGLIDLELLAAVVKVSQRFGGRADLMLERMSAFLRDREQAQQELIAMSAETRLSAWVLGLLPTFMAGYIVTFNAPLFLGMWHEPFGRKLLIAAAVLQLIGGWLLYRLAKSL